jgi:hypothetical protein
MTQNATGEVQSLVEREIDRVHDMIVRLERYKTALQATVVAAEGLGIETLGGYVPRLVAPVEGLTTGPVPAEGQPNTLGMARMVLRNLNGEEKTPDQLRALIKDTYGIDPAKSLDQMLYKRASKGKTFYKTEDGRFGLLELRPTIERVRMPSTAIA